MRSAARLALLLAVPAMAIAAQAQAPVPAPAAAVSAPAAAAPPSLLIRPARVFDSCRRRRTGWAVLVTGNRIAAAGHCRRHQGASRRDDDRPSGDDAMPGLIDAHSHIFLHPYANEATWNDQVVKETRPTAPSPPSSTAETRCRPASRRCATWHRGRRVRGRLGAAGDQRGPHSRPAHCESPPGHRRLRQLRPSPRGSPQASHPAEGRRGGERRGPDAGPCAIKSATAPTG